MESARADNRDLVGVVGAKCFKVSALIATGGDRARRREDVRADTRRRVAAAQILKPMMAIARAQLTDRKRNLMMC